METVVETAIGPKDLTHIVKGKRTKRQRPQSPIPFTITARSSSGDKAGHGSNEDVINNNNNNDNNNNNNNTTTCSEAPSAEFACSTTEEDEDTAKCLILLAQGPSFESLMKHDEELGTTYKFTSKRNVDAPVMANGKAGTYVYECRTCYRTFPSFQALGGHRASHKKAKATAAEEKKPFIVFSYEEETPLKNNVTSLSLQLSNRSSKVHECSICGTEFTSGQALGGHMRRHRGPVGAITTMSLNPMSPILMDQSEEGKKPRNALSLDLNLPAPDHDHHGDMFAFNSKQQYEQQQQQQQKQTPLGLSATPTLVDCHY